MDISDEEEQDNIRVFILEGSPIILVNDLDDLQELNIEKEEIEMVN